ncbi:hypothetical protein AB0M20_10000 [Actinoplanes sp. NPDC051633]|uniref:hypothetical protein n=1 Tax=Actinoplanes sp. NPDC051633 TaxID=3155670 RepID=UPI00343EE504
MTDLDVPRVRDALDRATGHLDAPPDLLDRVRAGGRRRVVRRRTLLGAGLAVAAGGSVAGARLLRNGGPEVMPVSNRLDRPTRGDLAGDEDYLRRVRAAWRQHNGDELRFVGEPHVTWAGRTPAGPVALVAQRLPPRVVSPVGQVEFGLTGFVGTVDGRPAAGVTEQMLTEAANSPAFLAGPRRDVLVVVDDDRPVSYSSAVRWDDQGRAVRTFRPLAFTNGASVSTVPAQSDGLSIGLRSGDEGVGLINMGEVRWTPMPTLVRTLGGASSDWDVVAMDGYEDRYGYPTPPLVREWRIAGASPDGRPFVVQTLVTGRTVRTFAFVTPQPVLIGVAESPKRLEVRLPAGLGWVVAEEGASIAYRVGAGDWIPVTGDAALLPPAATQWRVTRGGARPAVVRLPD